MPDPYVIFLIVTDIFGAGKAIYPIERINVATGEPFNDGEHILYVNREYRDDSDIGKLLHDFFCFDAADMYFDLMAEGTRYLKENSKGWQRCARF
ncbi:hypothetical protein IM774_03905 [Erysipelotrichaceae bacterium RD49]|nr:hypothetical protein [Erysipelotrichaceae bacterium RD49]